ncbi:unnamed protein product [Polarella glacialis]|uniref:Uncharacterized protein n=1 Tax=Polarella glacialis TaxID=89957 RepID=A0A813KM16_POLGL|nr:unnamed protein product [Polarella glacialis]
MLERLILDELEGRGRENWEVAVTRAVVQLGEASHPGDVEVLAAVKVREAVRGEPLLEVEVVVVVRRRGVARLDVPDVAASRTFAGSLNDDSEGFQLALVEAVSGSS